ncbi:MAG TPA: 5-formyltetrahydrofolate cyclo-ligase [Steroidobacteraceae bacterium]|jgi:5-formyltetrahydrofolate cyclo-ligase
MKIALRKRLRAARRNFSAREHAQRSRLAALAVARLPGFSSGKRVAIYLPFDRETDTATLVRAARRRGISLYVPVITDRRRCRMSFHRYVGPLMPGHFGIEVPQCTKAALPARWLSLVVVPSVGIDAAGNRLGMGQGFYDRAFAYRHHLLKALGPMLVGLAFDAQRTEALPAQPWDVQLDCLATESGLQRFKRKGLT